MAVLVTGGLGYIGSHIVVELSDAGFDVVILDNFSNAAEHAYDRLQMLCDRKISLVKGDVNQTKKLVGVLNNYSIDCVVHCAGYKSISGSIKTPGRCFTDNVSGTVSVCNALSRASQNGKLIFSSSATVYDSANSPPFNENSKLIDFGHPYGLSKVMGEKIVESFVENKTISGGISLRYFNPLGAHRSGLIGDSVTHLSTNIGSNLIKCTRTDADCFEIYGDDYETPDGTGVRDYAHVVDLAKAHVLAVMSLLEGRTGSECYNLGMGRGISVLELLDQFERSTGVTINCKRMPRRPGDLAVSYCDVTKFCNEFGFVFERGLEDMCESMWHYGQAGRAWL